MELGAQGRGQREGISRFPCLEAQPRIGRQFGNEVVCIPRDEGQNEQQRFGASPSFLSKNETLLWVGAARRSNQFPRD